MAKDNDNHGGICTEEEFERFRKFDTPIDTKTLSWL